MGIAVSAGGDIFVGDVADDGTGVIIQIDPVTGAQSRGRAGTPLRSGFDRDRGRRRSRQSATACSACPSCSASIRGPGARTTLLIRRPAVRSGSVCRGARHGDINSWATRRPAVRPSRAAVFPHRPNHRGRADHAVSRDGAFVDPGVRSRSMATRGDLVADRPAGLGSWAPSSASDPRLPAG
jgi:hypothetical protein